MHAFYIALLALVILALTVATTWYPPSSSNSQLASPSLETVAPETEMSEATEGEKKETYRVVKVVDGDTLALEMGGNSVTVRLIGLDTPETLDPRKPVQCFGKEATEHAKKLLEGRRVSIEKDPTQGELDKYGRLLVYVYLPDLPAEASAQAGGLMFNEQMISEGYGHEYTYNIPYKYQTEFKAAENKARERKRGLWADNACAEESMRAPTTAEKPIVVVPSGNYDCTRNTYNCSSFRTQTDAQAAFGSCGGSENDIHKLDSDKDGTVCESLP
ncbi:MAG: micrococcal nuclease [Parcubacteria group bacterium Gr01-1014_8]|nr:MAG: micrococcal nuclease [Parcubacteria group bacterium Gr01-1014_8]